MIFLISGRREQGKTTLAKYLASQRHPQLIIDPRHMIASEDQRCADFVEVRDRLALGDDVCVPDLDLEQDTIETAIVAREYLATTGRELTILVDEAGFEEVKGSLRGKDWRYLLRSVPRSSTTFIFTAHRPQDFDTTIRSIADFWILFRTTQSHDLDAIEERCGAGVREDVSRLDPYHFIRWDDGRGESAICRRPDSWREPRNVVILEPTRRTLLD